MGEVKTGFWKKMFFVGSLWNLSMGITGLLFTNFILMMLFGNAPVRENLTAFINGAVPAVDNLQMLIFFRFFMIAVILFGIGYYWVSRDLLANRAVIWLGLVAKLIIFFTFTYYYALGQSSCFSVLICSGDFVFSIFFAAFLWKTKDGIY
ncbi:MAG TPA: hypothetical protein P5040_07860 [Smithella sp.]|nr:hypothetical protein [Smithella sp.]HRS98089.1 hypothetical protein [Smithella sp.]